MLLLIGATKNQFVIGLGGSDFVEVELVLIGLCGQFAPIRLFVARVEKPLVS